MDFAAIGAQTATALCFFTPKLRKQPCWRYDQALQAYLEELNHAPRDSAVHFAIGNTLVELGRFKDAREAYEMTVQLDPNFSDAKRAIDRLTKRETENYEE